MTTGSCWSRPRPSRRAASGASPCARQLAWPDPPGSQARPCPGPTARELLDHARRGCGQTSRVLSSHTSGRPSAVSGRLRSTKPYSPNAAGGPMTQVTNLRGAGRVTRHMTKRIVLILAIGTGLFATAAPAHAGQGTEQLLGSYNFLLEAGNRPGMLLMATSDLPAELAGSSVLVVECGGACSDCVRPRVNRRSRPSAYWGIVHVHVGSPLWNALKLPDARVPPTRPAMVYSTSMPSPGRASLTGLMNRPRRSPLMTDRHRHREAPSRDDRLGSRVAVSRTELRPSSDACALGS